MKNKARFAAAGLCPTTFPVRGHGYSESQGKMLWVLRAADDCYRRELFLHEGTHGFMYKVLGTAGRRGTWREWPNTWARIAGKTAG